MRVFNIEHHDKCLIVYTHVGRYLMYYTFICNMLKSVGTYISYNEVFIIFFFFITVMF